ncbi:MAG TPA: acyltransferase family protein, partial [Candidatus Xenobia bacterium]
FCIHYRSARRDPDANPEFLHFWGRRLWRLYPPFLAAIAIALFIRVSVMIAINPGVQWSAALAIDTLFGSVTGFLSTLCVHLFMLYPFHTTAMARTDTWQMWTLALEEQLYLLYFLLPLMRRRLGMPKSVLAVLLVTLLWRGFFILGPAQAEPPLSDLASRAVAHHGWELAPVDWLGMGPARWFEWMLGAWAVEMAVGKSERPAWSSRLSVGLAALAVGIAAEWCRIGWIVSDPAWGVACFVLLNRLVVHEQSRPLPRPVTVLATMGIFSYSLYLVHLPLVLYLDRILRPIMSPWPACLLAMAACIAWAWLFYRLFEVPALSRSRHLALQDRTSVQPAVNPG